MPTNSVLRIDHKCTAECTRGWPPGSKCHCTSCGFNFGSITLFDRHRKNDQCLDPRKWRDVVRDSKGVFRKRV